MMKIKERQLIAQHLMLKTKDAMEHNEIYFKLRRVMSMIGMELDVEDAIFFWAELELFIGRLCLDAWMSWACG